MFPGAVVADLGCGGSAYFTLQAGRIVGEKGIVYAVDILKEILSNVKVRAQMAGLHNIRTLWSNVEKYGATKIHDNTTDFTLVVNILFQNKHPDAVLKEAVRVTKTGGIVLVVDWKEGRFPLGPSPDHKVPKDRVRDIAEAIGMREKKSFEAGQFHYGLVFEKIV